MELAQVRFQAFECAANEEDVLRSYNEITAEFDDHAFIAFHRHDGRPGSFAYCFPPGMATDQRARGHANELQTLLYGCGLFTAQMIGQNLSGDVTTQVGWHA